MADMENTRIQIFSQTGDYINYFGDTHLLNPWGILIHQGNLYVTDVRHHAVFLFRLPDLTMMKEGTGREEFNYAKQLSISPNEQLYVPDQYNNRIQILTTDLKFENKLRIRSMTHPCNVNFSNNEMFVLNRIDNFCIHVFTLSGVMVRSLVTRVYEIKLGNQVFLLFGRTRQHYHQRRSRYSVKVFSQNGQEKGEDIDTLYLPFGIAIHNNKLICVSNMCIWVYKYIYTSV